MLVPYNRKNHSVYNPFQDFDDLERAFFSDRSLGELKTDIKDTGDSYTLEADLPGFKKEDIHVDVKDNTPSVIPSLSRRKRRTASCAASVRSAPTAAALISAASTARTSRQATRTAS